MPDYFLVGCLVGLSLTTLPVVILVNSTKEYFLYKRSLVLIGKYKFKVVDKFLRKKDGYYEKYLLLGCDEHEVTKEYYVSDDTEYENYNIGDFIKEYSVYEYMNFKNELICTADEYCHTIDDMLDSSLSFSKFMLKVSIIWFIVVSLIASIILYYN